MELEVKKKDGRELTLEIKGESVTFANLVKSKIWATGKAEYAASVKRHPYMDEPSVVVNTEKGYPETAVKDAADEIMSTCSDLKKQISK